MDTIASRTNDAIALESRYGAHNYHPLEVVIERGEGSWVYDVDGNRFFDGLSAYSALNFGHRHPALVAVAQEQLDRLTLTSRAFHNDRLGAFCRDLAALTEKDRVLPMNTGAEGVETAIKIARKWGYECKGVAADGARIITCAGNFHGRTTTIISFSDDPQARDNYGPYTPGFDSIPYGDAEALEAAITEDTVAFLVEPVQGEAGVVIPPPGFLTRARELCTEHGVLFIADEIQSGLGRTGRTFAVDHDGIAPDLFILGKALGGGIMPLSAVVGDDEIIEVIRPGEHGSTFGGNPLASAIGCAVIELLTPGTLQEHAATEGGHFRARLEAAELPAVTTIRQIGLWIGIDLADGSPPARKACEALLRAGVLCKDTHETTIRFAPPLTSSREDLDWVADRMIETLRGL